MIKNFISALTILLLCSTVHAQEPKREIEDHWRKALFKTNSSHSLNERLQAVDDIESIIWTPNCDPKDCVGFAISALGDLIKSLSDENRESDPERVAVIHAAVENLLDIASAYRYADKNVDNEINSPFNVASNAVIELEEATGLTSFVKDLADVLTHVETEELDITVIDLNKFFTAQKRIKTLASMKVYRYLHDRIETIYETELKYLVGKHDNKVDNLARADFHSLVTVAGRAHSECDFMSNFTSILVKNLSQNDERFVKKLIVEDAEKLAIYDVQVAALTKRKWLIRYKK